MHQNKTEIIDNSMHSDKLNEYLNPMSEKPCFILKGISKQFGVVKALDNVELTLYPGQVTALIGENGAGKSTLVKIITGIYQPDAGEIIHQNINIKIDTPEKATQLGITAIHQETVLFDELNVTENIFIGHYIFKGTDSNLDSKLYSGNKSKSANKTNIKKNIKTKGNLDWKMMREISQKILDEIDAPISPDVQLKTLSIAQRHMVAIARALSVNASILILDEPTAALSQHEIKELYQIVDRLKKANCAILFISHKFDEIFSIADRYVVLRDGKYIDNGLINETDENALITKMVGRSVENIYPKHQIPLKETIFEVEKLSHPTEFSNISFSLKKGEILGFYGLVGAGRSELMQAIFGVTHNINGKIILEGNAVKITSPSDAIMNGIVYVPEERQAQGLAIDLSISQNIILPVLARINPFGFLNNQKEYEVVDQYAQKLKVKAPYWHELVGNLSGGNQQKVVIGKWLATHPKIIILDEPTKGIDVAAKAAVYEFIASLVTEGLSVILVSSELPEVMGLADRIIVMHEGLYVEEFQRDDFSSEKIVLAATGGNL